MNDAQLVDAAKKIDTPYGPIRLIHVRDDGTEVPTAVARQFAEALVDRRITDLQIDCDTLLHGLRLADRRIEEAEARARFWSAFWDGVGMMPAWRWIGRRIKGGK